MTSYLIRRVLQMIVVILVSAAASYTLLNFAPGGPLTGLRQLTQTSRFRITEEDFARIRAYFELDLAVPVRFTRWLIGQPRGPIVVFGKEIFANVAIGCNKEIQATFKDAKGNFTIKTIGCKEAVYLKNLVGRRTSNGVLRGDFGSSWRLNRDRPVADLLVSRLPKTIQLMGLSTLLSLIIGLPLGVYSAVKQYSKFDYIFTTLAFMGSAMPTFFFGILAIMLFSIIPNRAGWFYLPAGSSAAVRDYILPGLGTVHSGSGLDQALHLFLPTMVLTLVSVAGWSRYVRGSMLEVMRQDYVRTARAKGLVERVVIMKHALRNALIPFVTIVVFEIPALFGGAIITETIFSWPGMGRLYFLALGDSDYPVAMSMLFLTAVLTVIATLLRDILYTIVDPRIRLS
jgi:peptide/nickel transport system permease protein